MHQGLGKSSLGGFQGFFVSAARAGTVLDPHQSGMLFSLETPGIFGKERRRALSVAARALGLFVLAGVIAESEARAQVAAWASGWDAAFASREFAGALRALGGEGAASGAQVQLDGPDVAENGAVVPFTVATGLPGVSLIALLVEHNPGPLSAVFGLPPGTEPFVSTRLKMAESSTVYALVKAQGGFFLANRAVRVIQGGCAG
jgi:sulfur-oxidizing protein SoxY